MSTEGTTRIDRASRPPDATARERLLAIGEDLARMGSWALEVDSGRVVWSEGMCRILGLPLDVAETDIDAIVELIHPDDRDRMAGLLTLMAKDPEAVPPDGLSAEFRIVQPDGTVREMRGHGRLERDADGHPVRVLGVTQDLTAQRMSERELAAHQAVGRVLRDWDALPLGVVDLLARVGEALHYPMASMWLWDDDVERLTCRAFWSVPHSNTGYFEEMKRGLRFKPGEGKPGVAWETHEPAITADAFTDPGFQPREAAIIGGICSALAVPAIGPDGPVAILSFYAFEHRVPTASLVRTLKAIGHELEHFLDRHRTELGYAPLSNRELEVLRLAAEGNSGPAIAEQLVISPGTVKTHFENIYAKLGVSDRAAAVAHAIRTGLIR